MSRYLGIVFKRHDNAYKAKITIIDTTLNQDVIRDVYVDLYLAGIVYPLAENYTWWQKVDYDNHTYDVYVANGGAGGGSGTPGDVEVVEFKDEISLNPAEPDASILLLWQNEKPHVHIFSDIMLNEKVELVKDQSFVADGSATVFTLTDENTASTIHSFSDDGGVTWKTPFDLSMVWGSNKPNYDNEIVDADGFFSIKFFTAPQSGDVIIIRYYPAADRARVYTVFKLARNKTESFIDKRIPSRLLDYSVELFK